MKGFMKDKKFRPINNSKGTRKARDQTAKTSGVRLKRDLPKNFNFVHSFVVAKRLGIDTDGFVGTYTIGTGKNTKIVGYKQGQTFTQDSVGRIDPKIKEYTITVFSDSDSDYGKIFAINDTIAKRIAEDELKPDTEFGLTRIEKKFIEVK
jgi:hypothetical protein